MAEPTVTRALLRRRIAKAFRMAFYLRYQDGELAVTGVPTTSKFACSSLTQDTDFWIGSYAYIGTSTGAALGDERRVTAFDTGAELTMEYPLSAAPTAGDKFELLELFSASMIHDAINQAIREVGKFFWDAVTDETQVLKEDVLEYNSSDLASAIWSLQQVWIEQGYHSVVGKATASDSGSLTDSDGDWEDDEHNGKLISIYDGTGAGQLRTIDDTIDSGDQVLVTEVWGTNPDTTSKYRIWDPADQQRDWRRLLGIRTDSPEDPNKIYFNSVNESWYGYRLRLNYMSRPEALSLDADTTVVPADLVFYMAMAYLHESFTSDNRADRQRHADAADRYRDLADEYIMKNRSQSLVGTVWQETEITGNQGFGSRDGNPLDW